MHRHLEASTTQRARAGRTAGFAFALALAAVASTATADVPGRTVPRGTVPNPGTQQQELSNITLPAPYNVFEFTVTCAGCHGGTIDQQTAHFGVQGGTAMASAARDPVFRANQIGVNNILKAVTGEDGAGNMCMRCHSPNGWYSGRFDPTLGGDAQGKTMMHSIVASTDDEGISCETCHRAVGNVKFKDAKQSATDPAWNMLAGIGGYTADKGWPHDGAPIANINPGDPYGDTTLQFADGMSYGGPYAGTIAPSFSDDQNLFTGSAAFPGFNIGTYTGQIFAVYPPNFVVGYDKVGNPIYASGPVKNADGSLSPTFDQPVNAPYVYNPDGTVAIDPVTKLPLVDLKAQSISIEHPTFKNSFLTSSEMCASCHELTVPVASHGMPEQRTFTEWKYSAYAQVNAFSNAALPGKPAVPAGMIKTFNSLAGEIRCQDCHMPKVKHEYDDVSPLSLNADPVLVGWFPYAKDRNDTGGTSSHKHAGANRDLPDYMKLLYPEPDLEVIGAPTGNDVRVFPGMLSTRDPMFERTQRNTELSMRDAVALAVTAPAGGATCSVQVTVTNQTGHKIPTGYPDGRRLFLSLVVSNGATPVYTSGAYDAASGDLLTAPGVPFARALTNTIDAAANAVMVYERVTCWDGLLGLLGQTVGGKCQPDEFGQVMGPNLLNNIIAFDNRIPPAGYDLAAYKKAGAGFRTYDPVTLAYMDDDTRYPVGGQDLVTYTFAPPAGVACSSLTARASANWQTHTKEFMTHLKTQDASTVRPEGPVNAFMVGYPLTPSYLSDVVINTKSGLPWYSGPSATTWASFTAARPEINEALNDNWGGVAYAAWALTGKGAPYAVAVADTSVTALPAAVGTVTAAVPTAADVVNQTTSSFETLLTWAPSGAADKVEGYEVWIRYGLDTTNAPAAADVLGSVASWERLAVVPPTAINPAGQVYLLNAAVNLGKTYGYAVRAFNAAGYGPFSPVTTFKTPWDFPLPPDLLQVVASASTTVTLAWTDTADNECGFTAQFQKIGTVGPNGTLIPLTTALAPFADVATFPTQTGAATGACVALNAFGGNQNTVTGLDPFTCYNFQVYAYNGTGPSTMNTNGPVRGCTTAPVGPAPTAPVLGFSAVTTTSATLTWSSSTNASSYIIRQTGPAGQVFIYAGAALTWNLTGLAPATPYSFVVEATGTGGTTSSNAVSFTTPAIPPSAPVLSFSAVTTTSATLTWTASSNATGYTVRQTAPVGGTSINAGTALAGSLVGLTPGTAYTFVVDATGPGGTASSNAVSFNTPALPPSAPVLSFSAVTTTTATLTWSASSNATSYTVRQTVPASTTPINAGTGLTWNLIGLTPGTAYTFVVDATGPGGTTSSNTVSFPTASTPPGAPVLSFSAVTTTTATLTWSASSNATIYSIRQEIPAGPAPINAGTALTWNLTGLTPGAAYTFAVDATGPGGTASSNAVSFTTASAQAPLAPTGFGQTASRLAGFPVITVTWTTPAGSNGTTVAIERRQGNGAFAPLKTVAAVGGAAGMAGSYLDATVTPGTSYGYRIRAVSAAGQVSAWVPLTPTNVTARNLPNAPSIGNVTAARVTGTANDTVTVRWTHNNGTGSAVNSVSLRYQTRPANGGAWSAYTTVTGIAGTATSTTVTVGRNLQFRASVQVVNTATGLTTAWSANRGTTTP